MKKILSAIAFVLLLASSSHVFAQTGANGADAKPAVLDTMVTNKNEKIAGKITRITESEIEYRKGFEADAPIYVVSRERIRQIIWANGKKELLLADEMDVNKEREILDKRSVIKFHFFSPLADQITFSYEHCLKVGTNIEVTAGLINNSIMPNNNNSVLIQGGLVSGGVKFFLGEDYYINGMKYAHPLKGKYFKPEVDFCSFTMRGVENVTSLALMINYGRQFVLGNVLTFGYSVGLGYAFSDSNYSNPNLNYNYYNGNYGNYSNPSNPKNIPNDLYSHYLFSPATPIAVKGTVTIGYIFK